MAVACKPVWLIAEPSRPFRVAGASH